MLNIFDGYCSLPKNVAEIGDMAAVRENR